MGYVFDGEVVPGSATVKSRHRGLSRFLAVILFAFAAVLGLPITAAAVLSLVAGSLPGFILTALASPLVLMLGWLGERLWSGRAAPNGFVVSGMFVACLAPFLGVLLFITFWVSRAIDLAQ